MIRVFPCPSCGWRGGECGGHAFARQLGGGSFTCTSLDRLWSDGMARKEAALAEHPSEKDLRRRQLTSETMIHLGVCRRCTNVRLASFTWGRRQQISRVVAAVLAGLVFAASVLWLDDLIYWIVNGPEITPHRPTELAP